MAARFITELAEVCRGAGLSVTEVDGWQTRARSSGGYDAGRPDHLMVHHTASPASADGWPDVNYICSGDSDAPLANLYLGRSGQVWVCAAGCTNCNGSGQDPCGLIPDDSMNSHSIAIEGGNDGIGETWPAAQLDAYTRLVTALCTAYDIPTERVHGHAEWAPTRKVDPAGPDRYAHGGATWDMDRFRADCAAGPPPPDLEEDDMPKAVIVQANDDPQGPWLWWDGTRIGWCATATQLDVGRVMGIYSNPESAPLFNFTRDELSLMIADGWSSDTPIPEGYDR